MNNSDITVIIFRNIRPDSLIEADAIPKSKQLLA